MAARNGQLIEPCPDERAPLPGGGSVSKVEKYGWTVRNQPGEFDYLSKSDIDIDPAYQRVANNKKVAKIAADWDWLACGVLSVALRGNRLFVFDGGHRLLAARKRSDIQKLPCMVYACDGVHEEAKGFLGANTLRKSVTAIEKFKAQVMVGVEAAVAVNDLIDAAGYTISDCARGKSVKCVRAMMDLYTADPEVFRRIWPLVLAITNGGIVYERVLSSLFYIEKRIAPVSLAVQPYRGRLIRIGNQGILDACARSAAFYARGGAATWAKGVVEAINSGARTNRIELPA